MKFKAVLPYEGSLNDAKAAIVPMNSRQLSKSPFDEFLRQRLSSIEQLRVTDKTEAEYTFKSHVNPGFLLKRILTTNDLKQLNEHHMQEDPAFDIGFKSNNYTITSSDIATLQPRTWLNDNIVNAFSSLLAHECCSKDILVMDAGFYVALTQGRAPNSLRDKYTYAGVRKFTRVIDIFSYETILIPVNISNTHWLLVVVFMNDTSIFLNESCNPITVYGNILRWLFDEHMARKFSLLDVSKFKLIDAKSFISKQQSNGYDCGLFTLMNMEYISSGLDVSQVSEKQMAEYRVYIGCCLCQSKLLPRDIPDTSQDVSAMDTDGDGTPVASLDDSNNTAMDTTENSADSTSYSQNYDDDGGGHFDLSLESQGLSTEFFDDNDQSIRQAEATSSHVVIPTEKLTCATKTADHSESSIAEFAKQDESAMQASYIAELLDGKNYKSMSEMNRTAEETDQLHDKEELNLKAVLYYHHDRRHIVKTIGDGDCLYRAVGCEVRKLGRSGEKPPANVTAVKKQLRKYMLDNHSAVCHRLLLMLPDVAIAELASDMDAYTKYVDESLALWGGEMHCALLSSLYNVTIRVYSPTTLNVYKPFNKAEVKEYESVFDVNTALSHSEVHIAYDGFQHYSSTNVFRGAVTPVEAKLVRELAVLEGKIPPDLILIQ